MPTLKGLKLEETEGPGIDVGEQDKKRFMNEITEEARSEAAKFAISDQTPKGRAIKVTQWGEFYANQSRIKMENKTTSFGGCGFVRLAPDVARFTAFGYIAEAINTLKGAQMSDQKTLTLIRLGAKLIQSQLLKECNNRYTYIVMHMLAGIYSAKVPNPDDFFTRSKTFNLKKIMEQINNMYNTRVV